MCGIAGALNQPANENVQQMVAKLAHRGPDGHGVQPLDHATLGHTRLAILDIAGGQPLAQVAGQRMELLHRSRRAAAVPADHHAERVRALGTVEVGHRAWSLAFERSGLARSLRPGAGPAGPCLRPDVGRRL